MLFVFSSPKYNSYFVITKKKYGGTDVYWFLDFSKLFAKSVAQLTRSCGFKTCSTDNT